jgi:hypothetical protein
MHHHAIPTHLSPDVHSDDLQIPVTHVMMRGVQLESWLLDICGCTTWTPPVRQFEQSSKRGIPELENGS